jgi:Protein of unknown function (DUF642)
LTASRADGDTRAQLRFPIFLYPGRESESSLISEAEYFVSNTTKLLAIGLAAVMMLASDVRYVSASILNGSFEDTTNFVANSDDTMPLVVGSTSMTGWTVVGSSPIAWIGPDNPFGLTASNGKYFLDLTGYSDSPPDFGGVSQTIPTTPGATYALSFDLGSSTTYNPSGTAGITSTATATVGNTSQTFNFTTSLGNEWTTETMFFTATSNLSSTLITIQGSTGRQYIGLDNVSVSETGAIAPEPASCVVWLLLGLGGVSVCWWWQHEV